MSRRCTADILIYSCRSGGEFHPDKILCLLMLDKDLNYLVIAHIIKLYRSYSGTLLKRIRINLEIEYN